jgi:uncharacterized membrane protein YesL
MSFFHFVRETFQFIMENLLDILVVTLAWLVLLMPVITMPGATMALFHFARQGCLRGNTQLRDFVDGLKRYFWRGWLIVMPFALLILLLAYDIAFFLSSEQPTLRLLASVPMAIFSLLLILQSYAFVFFVRENGALWTSVKRAFLLVASHIFFSLALLLLMLLYFLGLYVTRIGLAIIFVGPVAVVQTKAVQHLLTAGGIEF